MSIEKQIKQICKTLPVIYDYEKQDRLVISGEQLLKQNPSAKDAHGTDIKLTDRYELDVPQVMNKARRLKKAFKRGGTIALQAEIKILHALALSDRKRWAAASIKRQGGM